MIYFFLGVHVSVRHVHVAWLSLSLDDNPDLSFQFHIGFYFSIDG